MCEAAAVITHGIPPSYRAAAAAAAAAAVAAATVRRYGETIALFCADADAVSRSVEHPAAHDAAPGARLQNICLPLLPQTLAALR